MGKFNNQFNQHFNNLFQKFKLVERDKFNYLINIQSLNKLL